MSSAVATPTRLPQFDAVKILTLTAPFMFGAGLAHFAYQAWHHWNVVTLDFRFFWLAGELWTAGLSPYTDEFATRAADLFEINKGAIWYYPPNWFPIASTLSTADPITMSRFWLMMNGAFALAASGLNVAAFQTYFDNNQRREHPSPFLTLLLALSPKTLFALHSGFILTTQAAGNTLHLGQSSMLIYFGASALLFGVVRKNNMSAIAGLTLLMLKPQIGFMAVLALALSPFGRRTILWSAIASLIVSLPALIVAPPLEILQAMVAGADQYNDQPYNLAAAMTGLIHLEWAAIGSSFGAEFYLSLCVLVLCGTFLLSHQQERRLNDADRLQISFAAVLFVAPLHIYDFALMGVMLLYAAALRSPYGAVCIAGALALWRPGNIPHPSWLSEGAVVYYPGSFFASVAIGAIFISLVICALRTKNQYTD